MYDLFIPGQPIQQGSMIARIVKGRAVVHSHASAELKAWRKTVATAVRAARLDDPGTYVAVHALFQMPKPKTTKYPLYPAGTPDLDKLQRAIGDALTESGVVADDARIVRWHVDEVWAGGLGSAGINPGVWLKVRPR